MWLLGCDWPGHAWRNPLVPLADGGHRWIQLNWAEEERDGAPVFAVA